jgi:hypothetical protein
MLIWQSSVDQHYVFFQIISPNTAPNQDVRVDLKILVVGIGAGS